MEPGELVPKLVAILAADAVDYSRLMALDDEATIRALDSAREVFRRCTSLHGGRVVDTAGDSVLAVFGTAMGATSAALAIQSELNAKAEQAPADRRLLFRIGLHLGDVVEKPDGSIYGDGVNIAARLQTIAAPGAVVASESLRLAVRGTLRAGFEPLGEQHFKNVAERVRAHRVIAVLASESPLAAAPSLSTAPLSILVLPFANLTGVESKSYIADALTASITSDLTRLTDLSVLPALTAFAYKNRQMTLSALAREADVRFVLQGSVMASGRRLRIAAQLSDTKTSSQLWNETFEGELKNLFALLDLVTARVGNSIDKPMVIAAASASDRQVMDASVGDLLLRARALEVQTQSPERFSEIESIYRQILQRDNANLAARAALAATLAVHASWLAPYEYTDAATIEKLTEARDLALAVKAVDPSNSRVYIPIALHAQHVDFDFEAARNAWEAALHLNPRGPGAHNNLAVFYFYMGEPVRAIPLLERSLELRPRANATVFAALGAANFALGQNDRAIGWLLKALDLNFENLDMYSYLAMAYANIGNAAKSAAYVEEYRKRAAAERVNGPRVNKPRPGSPAAYVSYFYEKLLPDWERAGLP